MFTVEDILKLNDEEINSYEYNIKRYMLCIKRYSKEIQTRIDNIVSGKYSKYTVDSMELFISNYNKKIQIRLDKINKKYKPVYKCDYCGTVLNKDNKFLLNVCNNCIPEYRIDKENIRSINEALICDEDCFNCKYNDCILPI